MMAVSVGITRLIRTPKASLMLAVCLTLTGGMVIIVVMIMFYLETCCFSKLNCNNPNP